MLIFQNPLRYQYHNSLYRKLNNSISDTTWGLLRGLKATPLKGDSERSERQRDEVPMDKIVRERKRTPILGAILFFALWALVMLAIMSIGITSRVSSEIRLAKYLDERTISLYLAKAALNQVMLELEKDETPGYDTLYELKRDEEKELGTGGFTLNLSDEQSLININTAPQSIIERLTGTGINPELTEKIINSRPFLLKEELLLTEGMNAEIFSGLKDLITVYGTDKVNIKVNINTVSRDVLERLGLGEDVISNILNYRKKGTDDQEGNEDEEIFQDIPKDLGLTDEQKSLFCFNTNNIRLNIAIKVLNNPANNYTVILERPDKIKFWQEK